MLQFHGRLVPGGTIRRVNIKGTKRSYFVFVYQFSLPLSVNYFHEKKI